MTKIAIITVNYNGKKDTLEFLDSLKKLPTTNYQLRTIIVDNASTDGSVNAIKIQYPDVDILQTGQNLGFAGGFNKGIEYAQIWGADYFLLINNDCLFKDGNLLNEFVNTLKSDEKIGLVSPKIYFAKGFEFHKDRYSKEDLGKVIWFAGGEFDWSIIGNKHRGIDKVDSGQYDKVEEQGIFSGACVLIKKEVFDNVGLLNEDYFLYIEDSDFAQGAKHAGFKIYYNGKVSVYHKVSRSTGIGSPVTDYYHTRNRLMFGMRYGTNRTKFALLREALRFLLFGRPAQRRGVLDFYLGIRGGVNLGHLEGELDSHLRGEYPLKLSIGIVNYNTSDLTKKCLKSIFKYANDSFEVIVLDNGSTDNLKEVIKEFLPKIKYLENKENEGFSKGYNKIIKYSLGEYFLMLNSDCEVLQDSLIEIIKVSDRFDGEAVLGGKLVFPDGSKQDSAFHLPTLTGAFKEYFLAKKGSYFMYLPAGRQGQPEGDEPVKVEGLVMACLLLPKKIINKVGLLDEGTFIFFEDIEYSRRLKRFGIPVYFVPSAKFIHHHGASTKRVGLKKSQKLLGQAAIHYHGRFYYLLLSGVLKTGQKLGRVKTPISKWAKN